MGRRAVKEACILGMVERWFRVKSAKIVVNDTKEKRKRSRSGPYIPFNVDIATTFRLEEAFWCA